jgi:NADH:ubiquinone reductase (non-electrogenic)
MPYIAKQASRSGVIIVESGWAGATVSTAVDERKVQDHGGLYDFSYATHLGIQVPTSRVCGLMTQWLTYQNLVEAPIPHQPRELRYIKASVEDVDFEKKVFRCRSTFDDLPNDRQFSLTYDYLILAPGCTNNTFGTPAVKEHAMFVRTVRDAKAIQAHIRDGFERASMPGLTGEVGGSLCEPTPPLVTQGNSF